MNRQNFDIQSVQNYPLTIDRMAELQGDVQVPLKMVSGAMPLGDCILAGCEHAGDPGYAIVGSDDGNGGTAYEVYEVKSGSTAGVYLAVTETAVTAQNSAGATVTVRVERYLTWEVNEPQSGVYVAYAGLKRVWLKKAGQDDDGWTACAGGSWWHQGVSGTSLRVQRSGGRTHLWGNVKLGLMVAGVTQYVGNVGELVTQHGIIRNETSTTPSLPEGYRPDGDLLIPILYNGAPSFAVINSSGDLLLSQDCDLGDTLVIDTWIDL